MKELSILWCIISGPPQKQRRSKPSKAKRGLGTVQEGFGQTYNKNPSEKLVWSIDGGKL